MKYVNKEACVQKGAVQNVIEEVELLREVDHPFVVSLWYTFQVTRISFNPYLEYVRRIKSAYGKSFIYYTPSQF